MLFHETHSLLLQVLQIVSQTSLTFMKEEARVLLFRPATNTHLTLSSEATEIMLESYCKQIKYKVSCLFNSVYSVKTQPWSIWFSNIQLTTGETIKRQCFVLPICSILITFVLWMCKNKILRSNVSPGLHKLTIQKQTSWDCEVETELH